MKGRARRRDIRRRDDRRFATRRLSYGFVLAVGFSGVFFFGGMVTYTMFALCVLVPVLSILHLLLVRRTLLLSQKADADRVVKNQTFSFLICLVNRNRFLPLPAVNVEIAGTVASEALSHTEFFVRPGGAVNLSLPLSYPYRGLYVLPALSVGIGDMLGLIWLSLRDAAAPPPTVTVYPRINALPDGGGPFGYWHRVSSQVSQNQRDKTSMSQDSRLYRYGDPIKRVHWKLSARKDELIIRQLESENEPQFLVLLDTTPPPPQAFPPESADRLVECAVAVLHDCVLKERTVRLMHGQSDGSVFDVSQKGRESFDGVLEHLAVVPFDGILPLGAIARVGAALPLAAIVVFTPHGTADTFEAVLRLCGAQRAVSLVIISQDEDEPVFESPPPFSLHLVPPGADITKTLSIGGHAQNRGQG